MRNLVLGESLEVLIDHRGKTPRKLGGDFVNQGVPVASAMLVQDGRLHLHAARHVDYEMYSKWMSVPTQRHDVLLTSEAPLGRVALVPNSKPLVLGQRVFGLRGKHGVLDSRFLFYALQTDLVQHELHGRASGTTVSGIRQSELIRIRIPAPTFACQQAIASVLGALDDKIAANEQIASITRQFGQALLAMAVSSDARPERVSEIASLVTRGVAPRYTDDSTQTLVLNQKCIRGGRVALGPARRTQTAAVPAVKLLRTLDVVVNSTGVGTLGRVAIWRHTEPASADSHVSIVRFDPSKTDPVCAGFAMLAAQQEIEAMGEGSTGQTELSRDKLGSLMVSLPSAEVARRLRPQLEALEDRGGAAIRESLALADLRDALLPRLMSGEIRVREAERQVEEVL